MNGRQFRPSALDRLGTPEVLDKELELVPFRSWVIVAIQGLLLMAGSSWLFYGRIPVTVTGEAIYHSDHGKTALFSLRPDDPKALSLFSPVRLVPREGAGSRLSGRVIGTSEKQGAWVLVDLDAETSLPRAGERYMAFVNSGERAPIAWILSGFRDSR